jgi:hypothetical protein
MAATDRSAGTHGSGVGDADGPVGVVEDGLFPVVVDALLLDATDVLMGVLGVVDLAVPRAAGLLSVLIAFAVMAMRTMTSASEPTSISRRRQYTDGGCDPTG